MPSKNNNLSIPDIPYKEAWRTDDKQWLKERKQQWKDHLAKCGKSLYTFRSREEVKADKHLFLTGELPEEAGITLKGGGDAKVRLKHVLLLHPLHSIEVWLALFEWAFDYERIRYHEDKKSINKIIASTIKSILLDEKELYEHQSAKQLHNLAYGKKYRPDAFYFDNGQFHGCPFYLLGTTLEFDSASAYFYYWIAIVELFFVREVYEDDPNFPIREDLDYLLSCLPYVDESRMEFMVSDSDVRPDMKQNPILHIMRLVYYFINPRAPINEDTEEKHYAQRLTNFFENEVPSELKILWEYVKNEKWEVDHSIEIEPGRYIIPNETEAGEEHEVYKSNEFDSLTGNDFFLRCTLNNISKEHFFKILHQCIADLGFTHDVFDAQKISLVNIKELDVNYKLLNIMGYKENEALPAWSYIFKADHKKLLNIDASILIEAVVFLSKGDPQQAMLNVHQRPVEPFLWKKNKIYTYGELKARQIKLCLLAQNEFTSTALNSDDSDFYDYAFHLSEDRIGKPQYDFPAYTRQT